MGRAELRPVEPFRAPRSSRSNSRAGRCCGGRRGASSLPSGGFSEDRFHRLRRRARPAAGSWRLGVVPFQGLRTNSPTGSKRSGPSARWSGPVAAIRRLSMALGGRKALYSYRVVGVPNSLASPRLAPVDCRAVRWCGRRLPGADTVGIVVLAGNEVIPRSTRVGPARPRRDGLEVFVGRGRAEWCDRRRPASGPGRSIDGESEQQGAEDEEERRRMGLLLDRLRM